MTLTYGSVCSGIEAASVAWEPLGMRPAWFAEIESFPAAVLAHRWPTVPNLGDMTKIAAAIAANEVAAPDLLVGGTPCQAFSVAGARAGLSDPRGQLTISYVELADAIDQQRASEGKPAAIIVWENVPGVLSSKDNAFGAFLGLLSGEECELEPPGEKWKNAGFVSGPKRTIAWRILDAQYFGVAQRRRRMFVIGSARADIDPAKILFESESLRRNTAPRRSAGATVAALTANGVGTCGADDNQGQAGHLIAAFGGGNCSGPIDVATACTAHGVRMDFDTETFLAQYSSTGQGAWADGCGTLRARKQESHEHLAVIAFSSKDQGQDAAEEISPTLRAAGHGDSHANAGAPPAVAYGFQPRIARNGRGDMGDVCHALTAEAGETGKGDAAPCVAYPLLEVGKRTGASTTDPRAGLGIGGEDDPMFTLQAGAQHGVGFAFAQNSRDEVRIQGDGEICGALAAEPGIKQTTYWCGSDMAVRRLTPVECERLQGFPDNHTLIPVAKRNKLIADELAYLRTHFPGMSEEEAHRLAADGPRYKAIGNSMAVPVMRWIGERILNSLPQNTAPVARIKPFLKWAGGKFGVLDDVLAKLPRGKRLIEPFAGGGSVFINAGFSEVIANDACNDLILTYQELQQEPHAVIDLAEAMFNEGNSPEYFAMVRQRFNEHGYSILERASAFIYLNRHCFNGLTRYNGKGEFNVGYGRYRQPYFPRAELQAFIDRANGWQFGVADCLDTVALAGKGDVIFCDPPYEPMPGKSGFTTYSGQSFRFDDQARLAQSLKAAHLRGASVVITNSGAPSITELYTNMGFKVMPLHARRSISCAGDTRETVTDIIGVLA